MTASELVCEEYSGTLQRKPFYQLSEKEVTTADFQFYGALVKIHHGKLASNILELQNSIDIDAWFKRDTIQLLKISSCIINAFLNARPDRHFDYLDYDQVVADFCDDIIESMPDNGGRIPVDVLDDWLSRQTH